MYQRQSLFLGLAALFAIVHSLAIHLSLYWYYSWFDIIMHLWGGALIVLGVNLFGRFSRFKSRPSFAMHLIALISVVMLWEFFEWYVGLYDPKTYLFDVSKDLLFGLGGGLITYYFFLRRRIT